MDDVTSRNDARTVESLAANLLSRIPVLTDTLVHTIHQRNPGYREVNSVPPEDLWRSCHDNMVRIVQLVAGAECRPGAEDYFDAAHATGRRRAEQRMPLDDVLGSFRLGGRLVWEALIDGAREQGMVDMDVLLGVATKLWEVLDTASAQVAAAYHGAERRLVRADEQRRAALWEGLLQGRAKDLAFAYEAARTIGVPVAGRYAVIAIDVGAEDDRTAAVLERRLAAARVDSAWQVRARTLVGLLALGDATIRTVLDLLRGRVNVPAGLSGVVSGLADVDAAYRQATLARRTVPAGRAEVASLEDRLPEALLLSSPELTEQLVRLRLGPLLKLPVAERQPLLETLETWLAAGGSVRRTAELSHCHRNTVLNRLRRVRQIIGHDLTEAANPVELGLALRAARLSQPAQRVRPAATD
jgi:PucR-like helix-turn-helix protein/diguanylate cyclase with GGDEF domain